MGMSYIVHIDNNVNKVNKSTPEGGYKYRPRHKTHKQTNIIKMHIFHVLTDFFLHDVRSEYLTPWIYVYNTTSKIIKS